MTKETLKKAQELDRAIKNTKDWMKELREADALFRKWQHDAYFKLYIAASNGTQKSYDITAKAALEAVENAHAQLLEETNRMENAFNNL